jgi:hypothetical protein
MGAPAATAVTAMPPAGSYTVNDTLLVEVWVEEVNNLYGLDIQLSFDPARLRVVDPLPGTPLVELTPRSDLLLPQAIVRREADNAAGTVWYAATQINPAEPVSGSGAVVAFTVEMLSAGAADLIVTNMELSDRDGMPIPAVGNNAYYIITIDHKVFLPLVQNHSVP